MNCYVSRQFWRVSASALLLVSMGVRAELRDISDDGMSELWGQAMFEMTNTTITPSPALGVTAPIGDNGEVTGTLAFSKITVGAEIELDAEVGKLRLGAYTKATNDNNGADINADNVIFTGYMNNGVYTPFKVKNPYLEFAMTNPTDSSKREILGFRFGFEQVDGIVGAALANLSGRVMLTSKTVKTAAGDQQLLINDNSARSDGTAYLVPVVDGVAQAPSTVIGGAYKEIEAVCLGRAADESSICGAGSGSATKDFWISVNKVNNLYYPKSSADVTDYSPAQKGVWMNLTDNARVYFLRNQTSAFDPAFKNTGNLSVRRW